MCICYRRANRILVRIKINDLKYSGHILLCIRLFYSDPTSTFSIPPCLRQSPYFRCSLFYPRVFFHFFLASFRCESCCGYLHGFSFFGDFLCAVRLSQSESLLRRANLRKELSASFAFPRVHLADTATLEGSTIFWMGGSLYRFSPSRRVFLSVGMQIIVIACCGYLEFLGNSRFFRCLFQHWMTRIPSFYVETIFIAETSEKQFSVIRLGESEFRTPSHFSQKFYEKNGTPPSGNSPMVAYLGPFEKRSNCTHAACTVWLRLCYLKIVAQFILHYSGCTMSRQAC